MTTDAAATAKPENGMQRFFKLFLASTSTNRDEAFRERIIRLTSFAVGGLALLTLLMSVVFWHDSWTFPSIPWLSIIAFVLCLCAAAAMSQKQPVVAGWLVVILLGVSAALMTAIPSLRADAGLVFMLTALLTALVLPRVVILPLAVGLGILFPVLLRAIPSGDPATQPTVFAALAGLLVEGLILHFTRTEFDQRLTDSQTTALALDKARAETEEQRSAAEKARQEVAEANSVKDQFVAHMSHELRTPLNAIIGYTEIMLSGMTGTFTEKQTELQRYIQTNAKRLLALVNDVLDLAKVDSGTSEILATLSSPRKVVNGAVESMQALAQKKSIYLKATVADDVPEAILTDVTKVRQIVTNLIDNAIRFTAQGGVEVKVGKGKDNGWQIAVVDTGRGLAPEALSSVFDTFHHVEGPVSREERGTGLGLAIVKRLVDQLGGTIDVTSELDKGTSFVVNLPRVEMTVKEAPEAVPSKI